MYSYLFFDLDGTLTDPGIGITNAVAYALEKMGVEPPEREKLYVFIGPPLLDSFQKYYGFDEERSREALRAYREYFSSTGIFENEVYPGIESVLQELKSRGKKLVLATSKPDEFAVKILKHFDLFDYFDFVAAATMDEQRTKKGEVIAYALESLHITEKTQVLMIGDRENDIQGAYENGLNAVGVLYGYGDLEELERAGAKYMVKTPEEILDIPGLEA